MKKETTKDSEKLKPGSKEAVEKGCKCPILDNADRPDDLKIISSLCKIHWSMFLKKEKKKN